MGNRKGFALAAALMILALLSVLGAAAIQSTTVEVQLSAHDRDSRAALYAAQGALAEARYYAARGWGKVSRQGVNDALLETPLPPGLAWEADLYRDFTLVDRLGESFPVLSHTDDLAPPVLTLAVGAAPLTEGRFVLTRTVPEASTEWRAADLDLAINDNAWALQSPANCWQGWTLWNAAGTAFAVASSASGPATVGGGQALLLRLASDPRPGPYTLSLNPWLRALAAGLALPGDADAGTAPWDREFSFDPARPGELGTAAVTAAAEGAGTYRVTAAGTLGASSAVASLRVRRAGLPDQTTRDWTVAP